jgi:integrase
MSNDMSYKGLGLRFHGRTWRAQKRIRKSCLDAYPDGGPVLYLNTGSADKKEAASVARQWIARLEADFDRIERNKAQIRTAITDEEIKRLCDAWLSFSIEANKRQRIKGFYRDNPEIPGLNIRHSAIEEWWQNRPETEGGYREIRCYPNPEAGRLPLQEEGGGMARMQAVREEYMRMVRKALAQGEYEPAFAVAAREWLKRYGYQLCEEDLNRFLYAFAETASAAEDAKKKLDIGAVVHVPVADPPLPVSRTPYAANAEQQQAAHEGMTLDNAIAAFMQEPETQKKPHMRKKYQTALPLFLSFVGDHPLASLRQKDITHFFRFVCALPPRWGDIAKKRGVSVQDLAKEKHEQCISQETFASYMTAVRLFLDWAAIEYDEAGHLKTLAEMRAIRYTGDREAGCNKQRALREDEIKRLFGGDYMAQARKDPDREHEFWFPLVGLYTGARVNEVCQLNPQTEISKDAASGIWFFDFTLDSADTDNRLQRSIKNKVSRRKVPIHSKLIELGFLDYVERIRQAGHKLLFPQWSPSKGRAAGEAEKAFRRLIKHLGLRDETPGKHLTGYHTFRHTMENRALNLGVERIRLIVGHAGRAGDASAPTAIERGYEGEAALAVKQEIIERIWFDLGC